MEAWVIKSKNKKQYICKYGFLDSLQNAALFKKYSTAKYEIEVRNYADCKPVKVRIEEV